MQNFENYDIIKSKIDNLISKIWISELTGIYEMWNASILMDIYYNVIGAHNPLEEFFSINWDLTFENLNYTIDILLPYWAWLWLLAKESNL